MDEEEDAVPAHVAFHEGLRIPPPKCSVGGMDPRLTEGTGVVDTGGALIFYDDDPTTLFRQDGLPASNTVSFAVVSDETVSHAIGRDLPCIEKRLEVYVEEDGKAYSRPAQRQGTCRIELTEPPAGGRAPVLAIEVRPSPLHPRNEQARVYQPCSLASLPYTPPPKHGVHRRVVMGASHTPYIASSFDGNYATDTASTSPENCRCFTSQCGSRTPMICT
mgnify:CR=1 FL=1|jgi:hypothetical protein